MKNIILLVGFSLLLNINSYSLNSHTPLPHDVDFDKINISTDLCSITIRQKIHATLFIKEDYNQIIPYLIDRYLVSKNERLYKFKLKNILFHDNSQLTAEIVKKSIEYSIRYNNFKLYSILGTKDFIEEKQNSIKGILLDSKDSFSFSIALNENDPNFLEKLADQNLSILKLTRAPLIGLGPYKVDDINEKNIVLVKFNTSLVKNQNEPDKIIYYKNIPKNIALSEFNAGRFDNISFYDPFKDEYSKKK